jgi:hypothetical protein
MALLYTQRLGTYKRSFSRSPSIKTRALDPNSVILPEFFDVCIKYVCEHHDKVCLEKIIFPPADEQMRILRNLHKLAMQTDIDGLQGTFIKLLMNKEDGLLKALLTELKQANDHMDSVREIKDIVDNKFVGILANLPEKLNI